MKIFEIIATIGPGGAETLVCDLAIEFARAGASVKLFLLAGVRGKRGELLRDRLIENGVELIGLSPRKPASLSNALMISRILSSWRPDIVHCHLYSAEVAVTVSRMLSFFVKSYFIRTIHNTNIVGTRSQSISKFLCYMFQYHVACSESVANSYQIYQNNECKSSLITIPNGCRVAVRSTTTSQREFARNFFNLNSDSFVFCHVGVFRGNSLSHSQKAQDVLLYAFAQSFSTDTSVSLVFAGDGPLRKDAEKLALDLGVHKQVFFLGNIPDSGYLYAASNIFVMPSRHEGLPIALLEAASTGMPIIASSIKEIVSLYPGKGWMFFPVDDCTSLADAMVICKANYHKIHKESNDSAPVIRERHSIEKCSGDYFAFFKEIIKSSAS